MNSQDFRNLQEAYLDVYEQEESLDEVLDTFSRKERYANAIGLSGIKAKITGDDETFERRRKGSQMLQRKMDKESKRKKTMPFGLGRKEKKESYDLYDIILSHLIAEGYADTEQAAEAIMVNMSEEWRESIVVEGYKEIDREKHGRMYDRYKKLGAAALKDARETGEASGDNRFKMSKMMGVIDKSAENLRNKR